MINNHSTTEVSLIVTVQVDADYGKPIHDAAEQAEAVNALRSRDAAQQAVENALRSVEANGFSHDYEDCASIGVVSVEVPKRTGRPDGIFDYESFLDLMDYATDHVWKARKLVNPDGRYKAGSIQAIDRAIKRLTQARTELEKAEVRS